MAQFLAATRFSLRRGTKLVTSVKTFPSIASSAARIAPISCAFSTIPHASESFLTGTNNVYVEEMHRAWKKDPTSVHKSWDVYFRQVEAGAVPGEAFIPPPSIQGGIKPVARGTSSGASSMNDALGLAYLIRAYQSRGHEVANLDPLGLKNRESLPDLDISTYGFTEADLNRVIEIPDNFASGVTGFLEELSEGSRPTLGEIVKRLQETYCNSIGVEYMHITDTAKCNWIRTKVEHLVKQETPVSKKLHILDRLAFSDTFERFLANKYNTTKRFGLDGSESLIPGLKHMVDRSTMLGVEHIVIGMAHRGRLNVLSNVIRKPIHQIFKEFQGTHFDLDKYNETTEDWSGSGDVKYHLGTSYNRRYPDGRHVHLSLVANPSHLEAVDTVVQGKARAKQFYLGNDKESKKKVLPLLLHGDAALSGQGIVYEALNMSQLENYTTGGTIHVVINNQVGFTTDPSCSRSTKHCTDIAKALDIPIFHVNGDDPAAAVKVFELAAEWRQEYNEDVYINLICYRRFGHNEVDNPSFTQPLMYKKINEMPSTLQKYKQSLVDQGIESSEVLDAKIKKVWNFFEQSFVESKDYETKSEDWLANRWDSFKSPSQQSRIRKTGVELNTLKKVGEKLTALPEGFNIHRNLKRILDTKKKMMKGEEGIDWGLAEALAWGSLLLEGNHVRISGQDVERGTFSHRHATLHDQETDEKFTPLNHLAARTCPSTPIEVLSDPNVQAEFVASNSLLSEYGVLGFELGYSLENPNALVMWEAQFGDFMNGAQIIIDQFLSSGESKWKRQSGLVMLLPHGYEGQGAEHSSCRVERFLQQVDEDEDSIPDMDEENRMQIQKTNWQVVYCSTPAQYFHVLRRQIHRDFRKPLISVQPKHLLRLRQASSSLEDMAEGTKFQRVLSETSTDLVSPKEVSKLVFCSGKIYYELVEEREKQGLNNIAIVRVEQIAPFPFDRVAEEAAKYENAEIRWVQEEPQNMGFWTYVSPRIETSLKKLLNDNRRASYFGRSASAATATGYHALHQAEQAKIVKASME